MRLPALNLNGTPNADYWRELREYLCMRNLVGSVGFAVTNTSSAVANGVCARLTTPHADELLFLEHEPERPQYRFHGVIGRLPNIAFTNRSLDANVEFRRHGDTWHVEIRFGKVQPRATVWTEDELLIGTIDKREVVLTGQIFGDNFEPIPMELRLASKPTVRAMTLRELQAQHQREDEQGD